MTLEPSSGSRGKGGLKRILLFPVFILILLDNEMLNLMPTTFKEVKPFTVFGLIWMSYEHRKEIKQSSENGHCVQTMIV